MTEQEEFEFRARMEREQAAQAIPAPDPTGGMSGMQRFTAAMGGGVADMARGVKQRVNEGAAWLERTIPGGVAISRATGGRTAAEIMAADQQEIADAKMRDAPLKATGAGIAGNITGNVLAALPLAPVMGGAVASGGASGFLQPTTEGLGEVAKNTAFGMAGGYLGDKIVKGISRVVAPKVSAAVRGLLDQGITPTPGQLMGGLAARTESKATSLPIVGDAIAAAQRRAGEDMNRAAFNRALKPIGQELPKDVPLGRSAVQYVEDTLGARYNALLPKMTAQADQQFGSEVASLQNMVATGAIDPKAATAFERILQNEVLGKFRGQNALTGQTIKDIEGDLGQHISRLGQSTDADQRLVSDALRELQDSLRQMVARSNPKYAEELASINKGWANFKRVQRAASMVGAEDGIFTPAQLQSAVKALDKSKDKGRFAEGKAIMQDLSDPAKAVLGPKYPDSGTAGRLANIGAMASGAVNPAIPISLLAGSGVYSPLGQKALAAAMAKRPQGAGLVGQRIADLAPVGGLLGASGANQASPYFMGLLGQ